MARVGADRQGPPRPIPRPAPGTPGWPPEQPAFGADWAGRTRPAPGDGRRRGLVLAAVAAVVAAAAVAAVVLAVLA